MTVRHAFWLVPAASDHDWLSRRITTLAGSHRAPAFEPHLTLHVGPVATTCDVAAVLRTWAASVAPLTLCAGATGHSASYYQTLFIGFDQARDDAARLPLLRHGLVRALLDDPTDAAIAEALAHHALNPHLSLLYGAPDAAERARLAAADSHVGRSIRFDTIAAVRPAAGRPDLSQVDHWDVFGHCRLSG